MTSRSEKKFVEKNLPNFYNFLRKNNAIEIYRQRKILSIYFDNASLQSYYDAEEGTRPRRKIRLRRYYNINYLLKLNKLSDFFNQKFSLEKKITKFNTNYKLVNKIIFNKNYLSIIDEQYGFMKPVKIVLYDRSYFKLPNDRITIDNNIRYYTINNNNSFILNNIINYSIVEFKTGQNIFLSQSNNFNTLQSRYSKYLTSFF
jgi:hypothetical protein